MQRNDEDRDAEPIELGSIGDMTKGIAPNPQVDNQGPLGLGGLSDD